jgi:hypothetical protein
MEFDEKKVTKEMRNSVSDDSSKLYDDDELLNVVDIIWDWYDEQGLLDIDSEADDEEINVDALIKYVRKMLAKDKASPIKQEDIEPLVMAELRYEQSLDDGSI